MRRVVAIGAAKPPLLPGYKVQLDVLDGTDVIQLGDMLLVGETESSYHCWSRISRGSPWIGKTVETVSDECNFHVVVARRVE